MYQFASGFNNTGSLANLVPQPAMAAITTGRQTIAFDQSQFEDGFSTTVLDYSVLTAEQHDALAAQFGTDNASSVECTLRLKVNDDRQFANFNAIVYRPHYGDEGKYELGFWHDIKFRVTIIEAL